MPVLQSRFTAYTDPCFFGNYRDWVVPVLGTPYGRLADIQMQGQTGNSALNCGTQEAAEQVVRLINSRAPVEQVQQVASLGRYAQWQCNWYVGRRQLPTQDPVAQQIYLAYLRAPTEQDNLELLKILADRLEDVSGAPVLAQRCREAIPQHERQVAIAQTKVRALKLGDLVEDAPPSQAERLVYANETEARLVNPEAFKDVCTQWGRAGYIYSSLLAKDTRTVRCVGYWYDVPEPGGRVVVYYLEG